MRTPNLQVKACLFALLSLMPLSAEAQWTMKVDGKNINAIISIIASDEYQGRETGTKGCEMTEEYFANEFRKLNLKPAGDSGTYFYHYTIPNDEEFDVDPTLVINNRTFYYGYGEDFTEAYKSSRGEAEAEVVFAGYGIYNPEKGRNDFDSLDISNKIVIIRRGAPKNDFESWRPSCIDSVKAEYCYRHGALGVLFYEPQSRANSQRLMPQYDNHLAEVSVIEGFPVFSVDERVVRYIVTNSGNPFYRLNYTLDNQTKSFRTDLKCAMTAKANSKPFISTRNVLAMIPGTDRKLKDEYILIGGHIDHVGTDDSGNIRNGADDNASGPAVALGIAQAMVKNSFKPKRSIVFVGWTGEEMGLLGSKAWCEKPTIDLKKIVVYFNLDMVGLGDGKLNMPGTEFAPEVYEFIKTNVDTALLKKINWSEGGLGGSDHNHFLMHGIPAFAGMTAGPHPDYHQPADDPAKIKTDILQFTGDFIYDCTEKIACAKETFISEMRFDENIVKLLNYNILSPVYSRNFLNDLKNKNFRLAFVDFSDTAVSIDPAKNLVALLGAFDKASKAAGTSKKFVLANTAYDAMNYRSGLLGVFPPDAIQTDELMFKVLAKFGFRLAMVDNESGAFKDTSILHRLVRISSENGVGLLLDNLSDPALETLIPVAMDPCLIYNTKTKMLSDTMVRCIKDKGHLMVFQPGLENGLEEDLKRFTALLNQLGKDQIALAPDAITDVRFDYFKKFLKMFYDAYPDKAFQSKIITGNFYNFAVKSLQVN
jgi:aminopeptidase YwaD